MSAPIFDLGDAPIIAAPDLAQQAQLRLAMGIKGLSIVNPGTGVATALAVNVGSAGAIIVNGGAGGTPSSMTLTNATGLTVAGGGTGRATSTTPYGLIAAGTTAAGAHQTLAAGANTAILVGGGASGLPVWTTATGTGAPVRGTAPTISTPTITGYVESVVANGTVTTAKTLSLASGTFQTATLAASTACVFTMPAPTAGTSFALLLKQDATTGNGSATFTFVKWSGGTAPTITATAAKMDILTFFADGTNWYGSIIQNFTP